MSDSVWPHRRQPTRLPRPWNSPGKNTRVGCHLLLQYMKVKSESEVAQSCLTLRDRVDCSLPGSSVHGIFQARVLEWSAIAFSILGAYWGLKTVNWWVQHQIASKRLYLVFTRVRDVDLNGLIENSISWSNKSLLFAELVNY